MSFSSEMVPLKKLGEIVSGSTPSTQVQEYWGGDISWITPADLTDHDGVYFTGKLRTITKAGYDSCSTKMLPSGTILFSSRAPIGHCAVATYPLCTNQGFKSIVPRECLDPVYGFFALKRFTPEIVALGRGATFAEINKELFGDFEIPLPPLPEQQRIAGILSRADRLRRLRRHALEMSESYLQAVYLEMFGDPVRNPMGWEVHRLGKHIKFLTSGPRGWANYYSASGVRFIRSLDVQMNRISEENPIYVKPPANAEANRTKVRPGDVLLTITGSRIGRVAPVSNTIGEAYVSQHVAILRLDGTLRPDFVSMFLSHPRGGQEQIARFQYGQTKPGLNLEQIRAFQVPFPPQREQERYFRAGVKYNYLRVQQREALRQAEHLFQTLLHRAFRGEAGERRTFPNAIL